MSDDSQKPQDHNPENIHLGTFNFAGKGPGTYVGGVAKLRSEPERDLLASAFSFLEAADRCLNGCRQQEGVKMLTVPGTVCAALACEMFLKYILLRETDTHPKSHNLDDLFDKCTVESRNALADKRNDIREIFERNRDQFVAVRYHHEREQMSFRQQELLQAAELLSGFVQERFKE